MSRHSKPVRQLDRTPIVIDQNVYSKTLLYRGQTPGVLFGDGSGEVIFHVGPQYQDVVAAQQWAIGVLHNVLELLTRCNQLTAFPTQEPNDEGGPQ